MTSSLPTRWESLLLGMFDPSECPHQELKTATSIPDTELQRHLQSLACAKFKILKKHPPGRDIHSSDSFSFNNDFSCPMQKIKISTVSAKVETTKERKETRDRIDEERQHQIEVTSYCNLVFPQL